MPQGRSAESQSHSTRSGQSDSTAKIETFDTRKITAAFAKGLKPVKLRETFLRMLLIGFTMSLAFIKRAEVLSIFENSKKSHVAEEGQYY